MPTQRVSQPRLSTHRPHPAHLGRCSRPSRHGMPKWQRICLKLIRISTWLITRPYSSHAREPSLSSETEVLSGYAVLRSWRENGWCLRWLVFTEVRGARAFLFPCAPGLPSIPLPGLSPSCVSVAGSKHSGHFVYQNQGRLRWYRDKEAGQGEAMGMLDVSSDVEEVRTRTEAEDCAPI